MWCGAPIVVPTLLELQLQQPPYCNIAIQCMIEMFFLVTFVCEKYLVFWLCCVLHGKQFSVSQSESLALIVRSCCLSNAGLCYSGVLNEFLLVLHQYQRLQITFSVFEVFILLFAVRCRMNLSITFLVFTFMCAV